LQMPHSRRARHFQSALAATDSARRVFHRQRRVFHRGPLAPPARRRSRLPGHPRPATRGTRAPVRPRAGPLRGPFIRRAPFVSRVPRPPRRWSSRPALSRGLVRLPRRAPTLHAWRVSGAPFARRVRCPLRLASFARRARFVSRRTRAARRPSRARRADLHGPFAPARRTLARAPVPPRLAPTFTRAACPAPCSPGASGASPFVSCLRALARRSPAAHPRADLRGPGAPARCTLRAPRADLHARRAPAFTRAACAPRAVRPARPRRSRSSRALRPPRAVHPRLAPFHRRVRGRPVRLAPPPRAVHPAPFTPRPPLAAYAPPPDATSRPLSVLER
jgi:hypothetical protein